MGNVNKRDWSVLSKYRTEIFGLSVIGIIILHYFQNLHKAGVDGLGKVATSFYYDVVGSVGVEIFLFLSGMGLYFSMCKDGNVLRFYGRRLQRLLLAYTIWGGTFWIIRDIFLLDLGVERFLYDFFFLSFWNEGVTSLWYIGFTIPLYFVYPLLHIIFRKENKLRTVMLILMLIVCVLTIDWMKVHTPNFYQDTKLATYRIPIFLFGIYYGNKIYEKKQFNLGDKLLVISGLIANLLLIVNKTYTIPFIKYIDVEYIKCIYAIAIVVVQACILDAIKSKKMNYFLAATGALSLELYMTHVNIRNIMTYMGFELSQFWLYMTCVLLSIASSIVLSNICRGIIYLCSPNKRKKAQTIKPPKVIVIE